MIDRRGRNAGNDTSRAAVIYRQGASRRRPNGHDQSRGRDRIHGCRRGAPKGKSNDPYLSLLEDVGLELIGSGCQPSDLHDDLDSLVDTCQELWINTLMTGIGREVRSEGADWKAVVEKLGRGAPRPTMRDSEFCITITSSSSKRRWTGCMGWIICSRTYLNPLLG
jgi:hypothetical protein